MKPKSNKLTKREQFIADHPEMSFEQIATQLNTCIAAIERSYDRLEAKRETIVIKIGGAL